MALTLVVVLARFRLLFVLQVALDELASVRRTAIQVVQITIVGAEVQVARDLYRHQRELSNPLVPCPAQRPIAAE